MFDPILEEKSSNSNFIRWAEIPTETDKDNKGRTVKKVRLRLMGSSKIPGSLLQCWTAWESYTDEEGNHKSRPHRAAHSKNPPQHLIDLDKDRYPKKAWNVIVWHVEDERPMVWEITQSSIKDRILSLVNNTQWGGEAEDGTPLKDVSRFTMEFEKHGELLNSEYFVNAEPTGVGPAPQEIVDGVKDAMIDVRVLLKKDEDGMQTFSPFGALSPPEGMEVIENIVEQVVNLGKLENSQNDQVNIQELRDAGEPIPMPKRKPVDASEETVHSVGSITRDAIVTLRSAEAKAKANSVAPEMEDGMPY